MASAPANEADEAALRWLVRRMDYGAWQPSDEAALNAWRQADAANEAAYQRAVGVMGQMSQVEAFPVGEVERVRADAATAAAPLRWPGPRVWGTGLAAALIVAFFCVWMLRPAGPQVFETAAGERRELRLPDGSQVALDTGSRLTYLADSDSRRIRLEAGAMVIDVAADPQRGLVVHAGDAVIRDIGTVFSVKRLARLGAPAAAGMGVEVAVAEGLVDLTRADAAATPTEPVRLEAGRRAIWRSGAEAPEVTSFAADQFADWREGRLHYRDRPLSEVLADLQRHYGGEIQLARPWLGDLKVTGTLRPDQLEAALAALQNILPVRVGEFTNQRLVIEHGP